MTTLFSIIDVGQKLQQGWYRQKCQEYSMILWMRVPAQDGISFNVPSRFLEGKRADNPYSYGPTVPLSLDATATTS